MASNLPPMPPGPPADMPPGPPANVPIVPPPAWGGTPMPPPATPAPAAEAPLPWEQPGYPLLEALFETGKLVLTSPQEAFRRMAISGDLGRPLMYAVIFGWIGIIAGQVYNIAFGSAMYRWLPGFDNLGGDAPSTMINFGIMIAAPILVLIGVFISAAIVHLFLLIVGGANSGFPATVRVMCYASTVQVLQVLPLCGGILGGLWGVYLEIIGIATAHRTSQGKAALAVLLPAVLCCVCLAIVMVAFGAAIWAAIAAARH